MNTRLQNLHGTTKPQNPKMKKQITMIFFNRINVQVLLSYDTVNVIVAALVAPDDQFELSGLSELL